MPMNAISVGINVTPTIVSTYLNHYAKKKSLQQKPTAQLTYHEGLALVREVLHYASLHTVEDVQAFTGQWVPAPRWIKLEEVEISSAHLSKSAELVWEQLGEEGRRQVGGKQWWQWRPKDNPLKAEWVEMRKDYHERKKSKNPEGNRIMLYVHGGAYYFGSVDAHRYQIQRHARKLKARVLAPRYRLAPQFPFPCGLHDNIAAYLQLLETHDPSTILFGGDSAGAGMVLAMLVTLRDQGIPLPAGAILISPWVDLTHSFPSICGDGKDDYIPAHGFIHKPSLNWPPPNADDLKALKTGAEAMRSTKSKSKEETQERARGYTVSSIDQKDVQEKLSADPLYDLDALLSIKIDGEVVQIKDQIQLYASNHHILHPLVSPVLQPTLGGLPPLLVISGGGELLKDEQIYLAHKAANPAKYAPAPSLYQSEEHIKEQIARYPPTNVQFQLWDDLCHVATTLAFTNPAKFMYRSVAQFGAWALAHAQNTEIDIPDDDDLSIISSSSSASSSSNNETPAAQPVVSGVDPVLRLPSVGKAGDPLPPFKNHMIRQRIDRKGNVFPLQGAEEFEALQMPASEIGIIKEGPVRKWMKQQNTWNGKFAKERVKVQQKRMKYMAKGYESFPGENPPPSALAGRRVKGMKDGKKVKKSWSMMMWSGWGSKHDEMTMKREKKADQLTEPAHGPTKRRSISLASHSRRATSTHSERSGRPRSHSRRSTVTDRGQADAEEVDASLKSPSHLAPPSLHSRQHSHSSTTKDTANDDATKRNEADSPEAPTLVPNSDTLSTRPTRDGIAYPFKLKVDKENGEDVNHSTVTLVSTDGRKSEHGANEETSVEEHRSIEEQGVETEKFKSEATDKAKGQEAGEMNGDATGHHAAEDVEKLKVDSTEKSKGDDAKVLKQEEPTPEIRKPTGWDVFAS